MPSRDAATTPLGRRRAPQQVRSEQTQDKLLSATIACLIEDGYAGLKTATVAQRAGVSEGGLFRHYPSKADLLVAAVERIFADLQARFDHLTRPAAMRGNPLRASLHALFQVMSSPAYLATNEVYLVARTDAALRAALRPMAHRHQDSLMAKVRELYGLGADGEAAFDAIVLLLQAIAIDAVALQDRAIEKQRLAFVEALATRLVSGREAKLESLGISLEKERKK